MTEYSKEFAGALFSLCTEDGSVEATAKQLDSLEKLFSENPAYPVFLSAPGIPLEERITNLKNMMDGSFSKTLTSFMCVLCEKNAMMSFGSIVEAYRTLYRESINRCTAVVTSAVELTPEEKSRIASAIAKKIGKDADITYKIDSSILGGIITEVDGKITDGSIRGRLSAIKEVIDA